MGMNSSMTEDENRGAPNAVSCAVIDAYMQWNAARGVNKGFPKLCCGLPWDPPACSGKKPRPPPPGSCDGGTIKACENPCISKVCGRCPVYAEKSSKCDAGCKGVVADCKFSGSTDASCSCASGVKAEGQYCADSSCLTKCDKHKPFFYCKPS